jgi:hypothetical protein
MYNITNIMSGEQLWVFDHTDAMEQHICCTGNIGALSFLINQEEPEI